MVSLQFYAVIVSVDKFNIELYFLIAEVNILSLKKLYFFVQWIAFCSN